MSKDELRFDGNVVIVTGAGGGLGRAYALAFAERGASVVVNDLGSTKTGEGETKNFADKVVDEIRSKGGKAVANYDSVENGEKVVQTALKNYGKVDILVNNAGFGRMKSFGRMSVDEWDIIHRIHLRGSFLVTKAVWKHMRKQNFGRIIMITSPIGFYGAFGNANYSSAKLGLVGLSNTLSLEGQRYNINVNAIAPLAGTRLTDDIFTPEEFLSFKPEYVAPLVLWLCHDQCQETGGVFECGGGYITKQCWQRSDGAALRESGKKMHPEHVRDNWEKVIDFSKSHIIESGRDSAIKIGEQIARIESGDNDIYSNHPIQSKISKSHIYSLSHFEYNNMQVILYALGVGASNNQPDCLKFLFEMNEDFCVLPTFAVITTLDSIYSQPSNPGININPAKTVLMEQYIEIYKPIPTEGKLTSQARVIDIIDTGSDCVIITNVDTFDESRQKIFFTQFVTLARGYGNFGAVRTSSKLKKAMNPPNHVPDASMVEMTTLDQAALYRLCGGKNPSHIEHSSAADFKQPILHGQCLLGFATRHVMGKFANNDPMKIKAIKAWFAKSVFPGQTLHTDMWKEGTTRVFFKTAVEKTSDTCLTGYVDLVDGSTMLPITREHKQEQIYDDVLRSDALFERLKNVINENIVEKVNASFEWNITKNGKVARNWALDLKNGFGSLTRGPAEKPECILTISDSDVVDMFNGKLDPQQAFFHGRFKVSGNITLSQKLNVLFYKSRSKM